MKVVVNLLIVEAIIICITLKVKSDTLPIRSTSSGKIQGLRKTVLGKEIDVFLGIPFAEPPIGKRRFLRPEKIKSWDGVKTTTKLPSACMLKVDDSFDRFEGVEMWNPNTEISEDCLYLNVWQPAGGSSNKAIVIWIYGGGFFSGSSSLSLYDGSVLAARGDIVVMSMQYRVGPLGFLFLKDGEYDTTARGSMGMIDQAMAIQWVHENAAVFGGDPDQIKLLGESAGAGSASLHLLSPLTQKIIKSSIMLSGSAVADWACDNHDRAHNSGMTLAEELGCTSRGSDGNITQVLSEEMRRSIETCLQSADAKDIVEATWKVPFDLIVSTTFAPVVDDYFLVEEPDKAAKRDAANRKSIMIGQVSHEGTYFLAYTVPEHFPLKETPKTLTEEQYYESVGKVFYFGKKFLADSIAFEYNPSDPDEYRNALDTLFGDTFVKCAIVKFADIYANAGKKVYMYNFNHRTSANPWPEYFGAMHGYEIDQIFGRPFDKPEKYKESDRAFSTKAMKYWINFIKTGDPNTESLGGRQMVEVVWPPYDAHDQKVIAFNTTTFYVEKITEHKNKKCQFWKNIYPQLKAASDNARCSASSFSNHHEMAAVLFLGIVTHFMKCIKLYN